VAATEASKSATAVPVASTADSSSLGSSPSRIGVGLDDGSLVGETGASGLPVRFGIGVTLLVGLDSFVALGDEMSVFVGAGMVEGPPVELGPIVGDMVGVEEEFGEIVCVDVEVAIGVSEGEFVGVFVACGESTVKEPLFKLTPIPAPPGSVAAALSNVNGEVP
jgi:hypothetical protein